MLFRSIAFVCLYQVRQLAMSLARRTLSARIIIYLSSPPLLYTGVSYLLVQTMPGSAEVLHLYQQ